MRQDKTSVFMTMLLLGSFILVAMPAAVFAKDEVRTISFYETHLRETSTITYKRNGKYIPSAMKKINYALRDWRTGEPTRINKKLIDTIWELHKELKAKGPVHIISGYRSPKTNAKLRRRGGGQAKRSQHMLGNAMDVRFPGVSTKALRAAAMRKERGGVGYYASSRFVHVDVARVRSWPRMSRYQLAMLFPDKSTRHRPSSGGPITRRDRYAARVRLAKLGIKRGGRTGGKTFLARAKGKSSSGKGKKSFNVAAAKNKAPFVPASKLWVNEGQNQRYAALDAKIIKRNVARIADKKQAKPIITAENAAAMKNKIQSILSEYSKQESVQNKSKSQKVAALTEREADMGSFVASKIGYVPIYSEEDPEEIVYQEFELSAILSGQEEELKEPAYNNNVEFGRTKTVLSGTFRTLHTLDRDSGRLGFKGRAVRNLIGLRQAALDRNNARKSDSGPAKPLKLAARLSFAD